MGWDGPILTDSGGFQVFSLEGLRTVSEDGVEFRSHIDGSMHVFTPESVMQIERNLGADVIMQFDHVIPGQSEESVARDASERSVALAGAVRGGARAVARERGPPPTATIADSPSLPGTTFPLPAPSHPQALFPIVQGGIHASLRARSRARHSRHRRLAGLRHRRTFGRRSQARHVPHPRGRRRRAAARPPALSHGRRLPRGPRRGRSARRRPLRLRRAHAHGAQRRRVHPRRPAQHQARRVSHRSAAARRATATAPRAGASRAATSGISSPPTRSSGFACFPCTMYISSSA